MHGGLLRNPSSDNKSKETIYNSFDRKEQAKMHFSALFSLYNDGFIEIRTISSKARSEFFHVSEIDRAAEYALGRSGYKDVYVGVYPRKSKKEKGGGRKEDIVDDIYVLFIDVDAKRKMSDEEAVNFVKSSKVLEKIDDYTVIVEKDGRKYLIYSDKRDFVYVCCDITDPSPNEIEEKLGLKPYLVVYSGGGYHIYFRLSDAISKEEAAQLLKALVKKARSAGIEADPKSADVARILRVAGTVNMKNGLTARIVYYNPDATNSIDEVRQALKIEEEQTAEAVEQGETAEEKETNKKFRELKEGQKHAIVEAFLRVWRTGARHNLTMFLAGSLAWRKIDPDTAMEIVQRICKSSGDSELSDRLRAVADTYIALYQDDEEKKEYILSVAKRYGVSPSLRSVNIASKQYLEKLLESGDITETEAEELLSVINETLSITPPGFSFWVLISRRKQQYIINDLRTKEICDGYKDENGKLHKDRKIIAAAIEDLKVIDDIIIQSIINEAYAHRVYIVTFATKKERFTVTARTISEIISELDDRGLIVANTRAKDAISAIISAMIDYDRAKIEKSVTKPGFFVINGNIIANNIDTNWDEQKLREAVTFLKNTIEKWFPKSKNEAATIIRWFMVAPFGFVFKQLGKLFIPWLYVYGEGGTGKTSLCKIGAAIWRGRNYDPLNTSQVNTEYKIAATIAETTLPHVVQEVRDIFTDPRKIGVLEIIKDAIESLEARSKAMNPFSDKRRRYPAFSTCALISNDYLPNDPAIRRRFIYIVLSHAQLVDRKKSKQFISEVMQRLDILREIGKFIAYAVTEYPELVFRAEDWEQLAEEFIKRLELATNVDLSVLRLNYEYEEETTEDAVIDEIREAMFTELQEIARKFSYVWPPDPHADDISKENILCNVAQQTTWLHVRNGKVFITSSKFFTKIGGMKGFAEATGAEYRTAKIGGKAKKAVIMTVNDFINFLCPEIEEIEEQKEEHEEEQEQKEENKYTTPYIEELVGEGDSEIIGISSELRLNRLSNRPIISSIPEEEAIDEHGKDEEKKEDTKKQREGKGMQKEEEKKPKDKEQKKKRKKKATLEITVMKRIKRGKFTRESYEGLKRRAENDIEGGIHKRQLHIVESLIAQGFAVWDGDVLKPTEKLLMKLEEYGYG